MNKLKSTKENFIVLIGRGSNGPLSSNGIIDNMDQYTGLTHFYDLANIFIIAHFYSYVTHLIGFV